MILNTENKIEKKLNNINMITSRIIKKKVYDYFKNKRKSDPSFKLISNMRSRLGHALRGNIKPASTKDILGIDIETYKQWILFQMTSDMNWSNIHLDHVKAICLFDVSKDEE